MWPVWNAAKARGVDDRKVRIVDSRFMTSNSL